jgi:hypothetical protein
MAMCLPGTCPNLRIKGSVACEPSAAVSLHDIDIVEHPSIAGSYPNMTVGVDFLALFRDPFRNTVRFTPNPTAITYSYSAWFPIAGYSASTVSPTTGQGPSPIDPLYWYSNNNYSPHGYFLYPGLTQSHSYVWLDFLATLTVVQSSADIYATCKIYKWDNGVETLCADLVFSTGTSQAFHPTDFTQFTGDYVRMEYNSPTSGASIHLTAVITGNGDTFSHRAVPYEMFHWEQLANCKINAASIMVTPTAPAINIGGVITGGFVTDNSQWYNYLTVGAINNLPQQRMADLSFSSGMYAFLRPTTLFDLDYGHIICRMEESYPTRVGFDLTQPSAYIVMIPKSAGVTTTAPGQSYMLTVHTDVEYITNDQWFENHMANAAFSDTQLALEAISSVSVFHENPSHWAQITSAIKRGANFMRNNSSKLVSGFSTLFPHLAGPIRAGADFFNSF